MEKMHASPTVSEADFRVERSNEIVEFLTRIGAREYVQGILDGKVEENRRSRTLGIFL